MHHGHVPSSRLRPSFEHVSHFAHAQLMVICVGMGRILLMPSSCSHVWESVLLCSRPSHGHVHLLSMCRTLLMPSSWSMCVGMCRIMLTPNSRSRPSSEHVSHFAHAQLMVTCMGMCRIIHTPNSRSRPSSEYVSHFAHAQLMVTIMCGHVWLSQVDKLSQVANHFRSKP